VVQAVAPKPVNLLIGGSMGVDGPRRGGPRSPSDQRRRGTGACGLGGFIRAAEALRRVRSTGSRMRYLVQSLTVLCRRCETAGALA